MIKISIKTHDGETGLVVSGPDVACCIDEVWHRLLAADPEAPPLPVPPRDISGFRRWCAEYLDGALASISHTEFSG